MRPISLEIEAFGPYLDRTVIEFDKLNDAGLFLITGSTGGGKTTLLDAMCIALYNRSTGARRHFPDMRSLSADNTRRTEVTFTFSLGEETYRFHRALFMKKKRGSEVYDLHDQHECHRLLNGTWELAASGASKTVTEFAQNLLHLTAEQFSQVIVLPQGDFLRLLRASSKDKGDILKTLFSCENWQNLIYKLADRQKKLALTRQQNQAVLLSLLEKHDVKDLPALQVQIEQLEKQNGEAEELLAHENVRLTAAQEQLKNALAYEQLIKEKSTAFQLLQNAEKQLQTANAAMADTAHTEERLAALQEKRMETARQIEVLKQERKQSEEKNELAAKAAAADRRLNALRNDLTAAEETRANALKSIEAGEKYVAEINEAAEQIPQLMTKKTALEAQCRSLEDADKARREFDALSREHETKKDIALREKLTVTAQDKAVSVAEAARMAHSAATLALELTEGTPCPVCGSTHHPAPAHNAENTVSEDELNAMRGELERLRKKYNTAENAVSAAKAKADIAAEQLQAAKEACSEITASAEELKIALSDISAQLSAAEKKAALRVKTQQKLQSLRKQAEDTERLHSDLTAQLAAGTAELEQLSARLHTFKDVRPVTEIDTAVHAQQKAASALDTEYAALEKAHRTASENLAAAQKFLTAAKDRYTLSENALAAFGKAPGTTSSAASELQQKLQSETNRLSALCGSLKQTLNAARSTAKDVEALLAETAELDTAYSRVTRLHGLLSGKNALRMPILQYVLSIILDETIFSANRYFTIFSRGRYALRRITGATSGAGYGGLDIEVLDGMSGASRSIETLSGGEQFLASLSLAFGLSEVVQANSGVVRMDSIFIDEGFGSLDGDTLDTAMKALETIRRSGRVVGIISHVSELRQRIPTMIRVSHKESSATATVISE
ncbi:MAG: SMC family ATPase [Clostridia bacterium]|nr:SMC family ATPase [Clostridia bacterium]